MSALSSAKVNKELAPQLTGHDHEPGTVDTAAQGLLPRYGDAGTHLLPCTLRTALTGTPIPHGLRDALGAPRGFSWDNLLPRSVQVSAMELRAALVASPIRFAELPALCATTAGSLQRISSHAVSTEWDGLPWSTRTRNALLRVCDGDQQAAFSLLGTATLADLLDVPRFGLQSIMAVLVGLEEYFGCHTVPARRPQLAAVPSVTAPTPITDVVPDRLGRSEFETVDASGKVKGPGDPEICEALEQMPVWADRVRTTDPRFTHLLAGYTSLADLPTPKEALQVQWFNDLVRHLQHMARHSTFEGEAMTLLEAALKVGQVRNTQVWLQGISRRHGLTGQPPATLGEVGILVGVTRERVRQVQNKLAALMPAGLLWAPVADQVLELLQALAPVSLKVLNETLAASGLTAQVWTWEGLKSALMLTGRSINLMEAQGVIVDYGSAKQVAQVGTTAKRVSNTHGVVTAQDVRLRLSEDGLSIQPDLVETVLHSMADLNWVSPEHFWIDHAAGRNRLVNTSLRILAVHSPQTLASLHEGVRRHFLWRAASSGPDGRLQDLAAPAVEVLARFYAAHPLFDVQDNGRISAVKNLPIEDLGAEKLTMVQVLRSQPWSATDRNTLISECVQAGMLASTTQIFLTYGECIEQFAHNVWGIRGITVPAHVIEEIQDAARVERRSFDKAQTVATTASGRPWVSRRLSSDVVHSGVTSFNFHRTLLDASSFRIIDAADGDELGLLRLRSSFAFGLTRALKKYRAAVGDVLRLTFFIAEGYVLLEIGTAELLAPPPDLG